MVKKNSKSQNGIQKYLFLVLLLLLLLKTSSVFVLIFLIIIGSFSTIYKRFFNLSIGIELVTFCCFTASLAFGVIEGAIVGLTASYIGTIIDGSFRPIKVFVGLIGHFFRFSAGSSNYSTFCCNNNHLQSVLTDSNSLI